jgi:ribosomal protein S18 acetylase RimI-like enzyme
VGFLAKLAIHVSGSPPLDLKEAEQNRLMDALKANLQSPHRRIVVAELPDVGLVGMGDIALWSSQNIWEQATDYVHHSGVIDDIWVEPEFRSLGIFKALLRDLVAFADKRGAQELVLEYSASNKEAKTAWTRLGFVTTGVRASAFTHQLKDVLS